MAHADDVTTLIQKSRDGDESAFEKLTALIYPALHNLAQTLMRRERRDHTLQPTALVNEAVARLMGSGALPAGADRRYLFAAASKAMRRVLIDHARMRRAGKRPDPARRTEVDDIVDAYERRSIDLLDLDAALEELAGANAELCEIIELTYFGGISQKDAAQMCGVSAKTIENKLRFAREWLRVRLGGAAE